MKLQKSSLPLYYQLEKVIRKRILSGQIKVGDILPTEKELCLEFGVSRTTVRQTMARLEDIGLIRREQGRGTFVTSRSFVNAHYSLHGHMEDLFAFGMESTNLQITTKRRVRPDAKIAKEMNLEDNEKAYLFEGIRTFNDNNKSFLQAFVPENIGLKINAKDIHNPLLINHVEKTALEPAKFAIQETSAQAASSELSEILEIQPGNPLLVIKRIYSTAEERVLEIAISYYPGQVFKSTAKLDKISIPFLAGEQIKKPPQSDN